MYATTIEIPHDCPVGNLSRQGPDLRIFHWCANNRDMFQVSGPPDQVEAFQAKVESDFGARFVSGSADGILLITSACRCGPEPDRSVGAAIREAGAWDIPPIVYREGWESWRVLAFSDQILRDMFQGLRERGELRILSLRPIENVPLEKMMLVPASDLFAGLTDRQSTAVLTSLRYGYYSMPSETSIDRLSEGLGVSPSTFGEHLRKGEARILRNLRPYLEAYASRSPGEVVVERAHVPSGTRGRTSPAIPATG